MPKEFEPIAFAASHGDKDAQTLLGIAYYTGKLLTIQDMEKAFYWCKLAADNGSVIAQYILADIYEIGIGVSKDLNEAFRYIQLAADAGFSPAQMALALYYEHGIGVEKDLLESRRRLIALVDSGNARAAVYLGLRYEKGYGGELPDLEESIKWLTIAADLGDASACFFLAGHYHRVGDDAKAIEFYKLAAQRGHNGACHILAITYSRGGKGVKIDHTKAAEYAKLAKQCRDEVLAFGLQENGYQLDRLE
jgi:TPR repeat protein